MEQLLVTFAIMFAFFVIKNIITDYFTKKG